jgi:uncharacterized protein YcfL
VGYFYKALVGVSLVALMILAGCSKNPTAPATGKQTVYTFTVTPAAPIGAYAAACPELVSGKSAVVCSVNRANTSMSGRLPYTYPEGGGSTNYAYTQATGQVTMTWSNSSNYVPQAFVLTVTVVNN